MAPGVQPARRGGRDPAVLWSLAGHGLLVVVVLLGGFSLQRSTPPSQLAIKATVVESRPGSRPAAPKPPPKPAPKPEPEPEPAPPPEPPPPDPELERRAQQAKAEKQKAEQARADKLKADKLKADQAKADLAKAEKAKADKARAEKEAADKAAAEAKKQQEKADREKAAKEAAARDLARQLKEEERLLAATDSGALADYVAVIRQKVERNWVRPPGARPGLECEVLVTQIPGGEVTGVQIGRCNADDAVRRSIEAAVLRASPLPPPDDAALFERNLRFTFKPEQ